MAMAGRLRHAWQLLPSLGVELENKGSVARDHLASERTFLAWMRTSLALVSLGIAIAQLFKLPELIEPGAGDDNDSRRRRRRSWSLFTVQATTHDWESTAYDQDTGVDISAQSKLASLEELGKPLGALCIALGALCLLMGAYRYYVVQAQLMRGAFKPSRVEVSFMTLFVGAFVCAAFGIIVAVRLQS